MAARAVAFGGGFWKWAARQDWFFAFTLAFFVGVAVWFGRSIKDFLAPAAATLSAPSLVGQTESDALHESDRLHLHGVVLSRVASDRYPKDVVMSQQPKAGTAVREGRQISLIVSTGLQIFAMPDLRYESMREVGLDLSHFKLQLGKTKLVANDDVPANRVVSQDPPPLSSVRIGSVVNVEVSKGPPDSVRVPNMVGMSIDEARSAGVKAKVRFGQVVWTPFGRGGRPRGEIVRQQPTAGAQLKSFEAVSLQVSAGPREAGYVVRQVHATASVPGSGTDPLRVRIEVRDDTGTWNIFNAYAQPRQKLDFNVTAVGTSEMSMYVNDALVSTNSLGVEPPVQAKQILDFEPVNGPDTAKRPRPRGSSAAR